MLNKPKFMKPSTNKEECTIDLTPLFDTEEPYDKIPFSCIVDGNESITDWQIIIYDITDNNIVYDSGKVNLKPPFYPVDEKNRNIVFTVDLREHPNRKSGTIFVNRSEAYYWTITLWGSSGCTTTSYPEVFYANKTPDITLNLSDGDTLTSKDYTFKAIYEQENGVQLKRYGWRIKDTDSGQVFIDTITKNQIYGSVDNIICTYDGFLNGGNYSVELFIETQNNTKVTTSPLRFSVAYNSTFLSNDFKVETLKNEPAIMLDWSKANVIAGILKDENNKIVKIEHTVFKKDYPVKGQYSIDIPDKSKVVYATDTSLNFNISEDSYLALSTQLLSGGEATLFFAEGVDDMGYETKRKLSYSTDGSANGVFTYEVERYVEQNTTEKKYVRIVESDQHIVKHKPSEYVWYNILMSPLIKSENDRYTVELDIYESNVINCIYPKEDLYPQSTDLYPIFGEWSNLKEKKEA